MFLPHSAQLRPTTPNLLGHADEVGIEVVLADVTGEVVVMEVEEVVAKAVRAAGSPFAERANPVAEVVAVVRAVNRKAHEFDARRVENQAF